MGNASHDEARRANWLLALPPALRIVPPLLLAAVGGTLLMWIHQRSSEQARYGLSLSPLVWCACAASVGLVRPAHALIVAATAFGMAGLGAVSALGILAARGGAALPLPDQVRAVLWAALALLALPAGAFEALDTRRVLARRLYFAAAALFFLEQGLRRVLGASGRPAEAPVFFLLAAAAAVVAVSFAERTLPTATPQRPSDGGDTTPTDAAAHTVRYLDETPRG